MNDFDLEKLENIDKEKALALASVFLSAKNKPRLPKNLRLISNFIITISALGFVYSLAEFHRQTVIHVIMLLTGNTIMLTCAIGLRRSRKWSLYIFLGFYLVCLSAYFITVYRSAPFELGKFILTNIIPIVFILTALYNWTYLK
jgi:hypothetical protein